MTTNVAKCPVPWIHPDDLIRADHPGMQLTATEAREVEIALTDALAEHVAHLLTDMRHRIELLHPIPVDANKRVAWRNALSPEDGQQYMNLEAERARYNKLCRAAARNDWTEILIAFTKGPDNGNEATAGRKVQPLRDALEARRTKLRQQQAARIGCTCC